MPLLQDFMRNVNMTHQMNSFLKSQDFRCEKLTASTILSMI